ncbi:MAG: hypothetical protein R6X15_11785 [Pseudomonadota bacterium]
MNTLQTITVAGLLAMGMNGAVMGEGLTDQYDPFVTADEIDVRPSVRSETENPLTDFYDPYVLPGEITATESCISPALELMTDRYDPYITQNELEAAHMRNTC